MADSPEKPQNQNKPSSKGYGKRPLWQWILLYVVVAGILYYLVYILFIHHGGSSGGSTYSY
jgi:magnesium-transporting ATPase (P-type)